MKKVIQILSVFMFSNLLTSCNNDFKEAVQVSLNIQEAKEKKVFVTEYEIIEIQSFANNYIFPIKSIWEEKAWHLKLDKNKKETFKIINSTSNNLIFQLNEKEIFITNDNFLIGKWIMWMNNSENPIGSTRGMININLVNQVINDTNYFTIYRQKEPNDHKNNLTPLFKFGIVRKEERH